MSRYLLIFLSSSLLSIIILYNFKQKHHLKYIPFFLWGIISSMLFLKGDLKTSIGIILSSFLILFMDSKDILWNKKFDKKFLKNTLLWVGIVTILYFTNIKISFLSKPDGSYIYFGKIGSLLFTTLWLLLIVNSIKLTSLLSGLTSAFTFTTSLVFFVIAAAQRQNLTTALILSLTLSAISLSSINYEFKYPHLHIERRLNLLYGFLLGIISITGMLKSPATISIIIPAILLSIPIIDTSYAIVSTFVIGRPKNLILEKIARQFNEKNISPSKIPFIVYSIGLYLAFSTLILYFFPNIFMALFLMAIGISFYGKLISIGGKISSIEKASINSEKLYVLGIPVDKVNLEKAAKKIESFILSQEPHIVITPDSIAILTAKKDKKYREVINHADLVTPDGIGILLASKIYGDPLSERVTGIDLINKLFELGERKGYSFYFLGARKGVAEKAKEKVSKKYPNIKIVGTYHGYISTEEEEKKIKEEIKRKRPNILLVGMGVPKQEIWIYENIKDLNTQVAIGVGGSFDVLSGNIPRAPLWMQKSGIEWTYRLLREPKRIIKIMRIPLFLLFVIFSGLSHRIKILTLSITDKNKI